MSRVLYAAWAAALLAAAVTSAAGASRGGTPATLTGSIVQTDQTWICSGPVDLDSVTVTMDAGAQTLPRAGRDAIHLENGCTGRIGSITVVQYAADGVKVGPGAHDLVIGGGSIRCLAKSPILHQDGIQAMTGTNITFQNLAIDCGREGEPLINSDIFIKQGNAKWPPPTNIVCDGCSLNAGAAHTADIQTSVASGLRNSTLCPAKFPSLTLTIGPQAVDPVNSSNQLLGCGGAAPPPTATTQTTTTPAKQRGPERLTIAPSVTTVTAGSAVVLSGALSSGRPNRQIQIYARPYGIASDSLVASVRTGAGGEWRLTVQPEIATTYQARARDYATADISVAVRPVVLVDVGASQVTVHVVAVGSLRGTKVQLERLAGTRWSTVATATLGSLAAAELPRPQKGATLRVSVPALPGYLATASAPVRG